MPENRTRRLPLVTPAVVVFWAIMMALLVQREVWPRLQASWAEGRRATYADLLEDLPATHRTRMRMTWNEKEVGRTTSTARRVGERYTLSTRTEIDTGALANLFLVPRTQAQERIADDVTQIVVDTETVIGPNFNLIRFRANAQTRPAIRKIAQVTGRMAGDKLRLAVTDFAGRTYETEVPFDPAAMLSQSLNATFGREDLQVGRTWSIQIINPLTGKVEPAFAEVLRAEPFAWNGTVQQVFVIEVTLGNVTTRSWVTPEGEVLRQTTPFGIVLEREPIPDDTESDTQTP